MTAVALVTAAVLLALTVLAYLPALRAGFIWDDDAHVTSPALRSAAGFARIWTDVRATQQYYPLLHTAFWLEHRLWGDAPFGYHLVNLVLHTGAAVLFWLTLRRLAIPGATLAAAWFALHPVQVESVAWISEQKNTLSAVFYLGAALAYLRFDTSRRPAHYGLALGLFVLGLMTKTMVATLPAALLVVFWWRRGRLSWRSDVRPLAPWFLIGAGAGLFTAWIEHTVIGASGADFDLSATQRLLLAGRIVWFYPGKLLWPVDLTFIYPRWTIDAHAPAQWLPLVAALTLVVFLTWLARTHTRAPLAAVLLFTGTLFPVLGFFNVYPFRYSYVADHFQYLPSLALFALAGAAWAQARAFAPQTVRVAIAAAALVLLGRLTWTQAGDYRDAQTLYRATLARNPDCWMAHNNLGKELQADKAHLPEAIDHFRRAIALRPDYAEAHNNLGLALVQSRRPVDAIPHFETALRLKPELHQTHNNLGIALASSGRVEESLAAFARAAALNPYLPNIEENWAKALTLLGRHREAAEHFARASRLKRERSTREPASAVVVPSGPGA